MRSPRQRRSRRPAKDRAIFIRRHGDGFTVTVEPHPEGKAGYQSRNRRMDTHRAADAYATFLRKGTGWALVDETQGGAGVVSDPRRPTGRSTVFVYERADGVWPVTLSPPPWGCAKPVTECLRFGAAYQLAIRLSEQHGDEGGPLAIVAGEPS